MGAILLAGAGMIALTMQTDTVQAAYGSALGQDGVDALHMVQDIQAIIRQLPIQDILI